MTTKEVVDNLQYKIFGGEGEFSNNFSLEYSEYGGYAEAVALYIISDKVHIKVDLWNSENDERKYDYDTDIAEDLEVYILRQIENCEKSFKKLRLILNK